MSAANYGPAYDYDAQAWVHGAAAVKLHLRAIREQLACLTGTRRAEYARFAGIADAAAAVAELETQEAELEAQRMEHDAEELAAAGILCLAVDQLRAQARALRRGGAQ